MVRVKITYDGEVAMIDRDQIIATHIFDGGFIVYLKGGSQIAMGDGETTEYTITEELLDDHEITDEEPD